MSDLYSCGLPPTSSHPNGTAPLRRPHAPQPSSLRITALDPSRGSHHAPGNTVQTPASASSLSTPFSAHPSSAYPQSPAAAIRGPVASSPRNQTPFSAIYNPQQWGPINGASPQASINPHRYQPIQTLAPQPTGPDGKHDLLIYRLLPDTNVTEPVASPPPPYSPRRQAAVQSSPGQTQPGVLIADAISPGTDSSHHSTPTSASLTYPDVYAGRGRIHRAVGSSSPSLVSPPAFPPPPPAGPSKSRNRAGSKTHASSLLSTLRLRAPQSNAMSDAIITLREDTDNILAQAAMNPVTEHPLQAPGARRAASTGGIGLTRDSRSTFALTESPTTSNDGIPLPPPPPGPPPAANRTHSLNRFSDKAPTRSATNAPSRTRIFPGSGTVLDTIPPTPANWQDGHPTTPRERSHSKGVGPLHIDVGDILNRQEPFPAAPNTVTGATTMHTRRASSSQSLLRSPAVRNRSAKGIRERRNESRHGKEKASNDSSVAMQQVDNGSDFDNVDSVKPANLVLSNLPSPSRKASAKVSPTSGQSYQSMDRAVSDIASPISLRQVDTYTSPSQAPSGHFSPRSVQDIKRNGPENETQNLSFADGYLQAPHGQTDVDRPVSHLLHIPISKECHHTVLPPSSLSQDRPISDLLGPENSTDFAARANERHRRFAEKEAAAANESEKLELFVHYMLAESRIRREQYASTFEEQSIQTADLVQGFFALPAASDSGLEERPEGRVPSDQTSIASSGLDESSQEETDSFTRQQESPSSATTAPSSINRPNSGWAKDYVPCLSPIASMSVVTGQDESESRGRAPSRWWEGSHSEGVGSSDGLKVLARSKSESKYMGLPKEVRQSPAMYEQQTTAPPLPQWQSSSQNHSFHSYGPDDYPPEKTGLHEEDSGASRSALAPPLPPSLPATPSSAPYTPNLRQLDVSRLVTLPPPYPRHHPALNNSHPDLAGIRATVRTLNEKGDFDAIRRSYEQQLEVKRRRAISFQEHQRSLHQQDIDFKIAHGELSSSAYEEAKVELERKVFESEKELTQIDFDIFQELVVSPIHATLIERLKLATETLDQLSQRVFNDSQSQSPNLPQEEGDERPELLEMLTMLKWIFDARESAHRQLFDLLTERNDKYKAVVLQPYSHAKNEAKVLDAQTFFIRDATDRRQKFDQSASDRTHEFLQVIESNVTRGVEVQLDAFWSIAPQLRELLQKVPSTEAPHGIEILIPPDEYLENPTYHEYPLQYLYSLLGHAEKSSYQFIESQVNMLCLLHEIRNATLLSRLRAHYGNKGAYETATDDLSQRQMWETRQRAEQAREEASMTADLKEKVGLIEGQWTEALGAELLATRERVRGWLLEQGGWDEEQAADT